LTTLIPAAEFLGLVALVVAAVAALAEIVVRVRLANDKDAGFVPGDLRRNTYAERMLRDRPDRQAADTFFPHPYLGWVLHNHPPHGFGGVNRQGFFGEEFPLEKRDDAYVILFGGGSVAMSMGVANPNGVDATGVLQNHLNRTYRPPRGDRFLVIAGGLGGWKQPQPAIQFMLYADVVDACVTLSGFNESYTLQSNMRLEWPASAFHIANPAATFSLRGVLGLELTGMLQRMAQSRIAQRLRSVQALIMVVRNWIGRSLVTARPTGGALTSIDNMFASAANNPDWSEAWQHAHTTRQFRKYLTAMHLVGRAVGAPVLHFIQPIAALGKRLTPAEERVAGDLALGDSYKRMVDGLLTMRDEGCSIHSLVDVFQDIDEAVYVDAVHCEGGYEMLATAMGDIMAKELRFARK
jgi:hypothetical protein